jgi:hypothetical protein
MYGHGVGKCGYKTKTLTLIWGKYYIIYMKIWPGSKKLMQSAGKV